MPHYRTDFNNACQTLGRTGTVNATTSGPRNSVTWTAIAYVNNVEYGKATGATKSIATEAASAEALQALRDENPGYDI